MPEEFLETFISYGIFSMLFVWLLLATNKRNDAREVKYHAMITNFQERCEKREENDRRLMGEQAKALGLVAQDINEIKHVLYRHQ